MATRSSCHLCTLLLFLWLALLTSGQVTKDLKSVVALEGSTAVFSCAGHASDGVNVNIDNDQEHITSWPVNVTEYGALITGYTGDGDIRILQIAIVATLSNNGTKIECHFVDDDVHNAKTGPVKLYIPSEELGSNPGFITPIVSTSPSQLTISWSPPWSHLVNSYTVTVVNKTTNDWTTHDVPDKNIRSFIIDDGSDGQCSEYDVYVTAFTDIGDTGSSIVHTGLSKEIQSIHPENITIIVYRALWSNELKVEVSLKAPDHCSHVQTLLYNYTVMSNGVELQCNGPSSSTETDFEGIVEINTNYTLHVMHWESGGLPQLVTKAFTTFQQDVAVDPHLHSMLTVTVPASTSTQSTESLNTPIQQTSVTSIISSTTSVTVPASTSMQSTESLNIPMQQTSVTSIISSTTSVTSITEQPSQQTNSAVLSVTSITEQPSQQTNSAVQSVKSADWKPTIITSVIAIATCTVVIAMVAVIGCLMVRKNRENRRKNLNDMFKEVNTLPNGTSIEVHNVVPRERSRTLYTRPTTTRPVRKERRPSVPQMMATNPLYEESSPIYSCLHNPSDLRSLNSHPQGSPPPPIPPASNNRGNELQFDIPPQLPLPRKQTLDSPGVKAGVLLSLDKQLGTVPPNDTNEQYIEMKSTGEQRYVKSPSLKRKDIFDGTKKSHDNIIVNDGNEKQD